MSEWKIGAEVFVKPTSGSNKELERISEDAAKQGGPLVILNTLPGNKFNLGKGGVVTHSGIMGHKLETPSERDRRVSGKKRDQQKKAFADQSFTR
jgi:hypothetical protein